MVEWAFGLSRRHLPGETLVINEGQSQIPDLAERRHFARYFMQIERAIAKGAQIDKIGLQHHIFTGCTARTPDEYDVALQNPTYVDPRQTLSALDTLARIGLPLEITEMTVPTFGDTPEDEELQADLLEYIYTVLFSHPALDSIVYWNTVEGHCYDAGPDALWNENRCRSTLFRRDLTPKPAADMLYHLTHEVWHTEYEGETDENGNLTVHGFYGDYELLCEGETFAFGVHK
jgi:GH35 family endo-1,4-beta-xylanase